VTSSPALARAAVSGLAAVEEVLWIARAVRNRVDALAVRTGRVADAVQWEAPSARAFRARADELERAVRSAQARADDAVDGLRRTQARLLAGTAIP
jgi:hypothetical protein